MGETVAALKINFQLFRILNGLRYFGVGAKVTRSSYHFPDTYWIITKVKLSKDQNHGYAVGRLVWRGVSKADDSKVATPYKHEWRLLEVPNYKQFHATDEDILKLIPPGHPYTKTGEPRDPTPTRKSLAEMAAIHAARNVHYAAVRASKTRAARKLLHKKDNSPYPLSSPLRKTSSSTTSSSQTPSV